MESLGGATGYSNAYHSAMPVDPVQLKIVFYPHPVLRRKAQPVPAIDEEVRGVAERMVQLMHEAKGVGLAAPQVGLSWRLFVANPSNEPGDDRVFINPSLEGASPIVDAAEEGCLSIPEVRGEVRRPASISVRATDLEGREFVLSSDELPARVWQHEIDHLDGVLIIDKITPLDRIANKKKLQELEARFKG